MSRRLLLPALAAATAWPFVEPQLPVLRRRTVPVLPDGSPPLRVLHLSDLHLLPRHRRRAAWVRRLAAHGADLVVSTGDHLSSTDAVPLLVETFAALTAQGAPGVFVPGNNDYWLPTVPNPLDYLRGGPPAPRGEPLPWDEVATALTSAGWTDLTQRRTEVALPGRSVLLTGTDDAHLGLDRYDDVAGPVDGFAIGVTHTPQRRLLRRFADDGHALVLAGHTHGGQLRLPGLGPLTTNSDLERSRARGLSPLTAGSPGRLHVSAGLGSSPYVPVRLCCRPEATLLELVPAAADRGVR